MRIVWAIALAAALAGGCGPGIAAPERTGVVTFAPSITETVFAIGQGDRVTGVTDFCLYPPEVAALPKLGGVFNPDLEALAALAPAVLIVPGPSSTGKLAEFARRMGVAVVDGHMDSLATIDAGIQRIGDALGAADEATMVRQEIAAQLDAIARAVADRPRPRVLLVASRDTHTLDSVFTMGGTSFLSELLDVAGGENIFAGETQPYFEASKEAIVASEPDAIVEFHAGEALTEEELARFRSDWSALPTLPAVRDGRVYLLTEDFTLIPGPRIVETARLLAQRLHGDGDAAP